jgi:hypothetical protein
MTVISVLFARRDSIYKTMSECDVWDEDRDARRYVGSNPVIAHPPCRFWGNLRFLRKVKENMTHAERALAVWSIGVVNRNGGVVEHPITSNLFKRITDYSPGYVLPVDQYWWGHPCRKRTGLYIVGCERKDIPPIPYELDGPRRIKMNDTFSWDPVREATPPEFAGWLVDLAKRAA